MRLCFSFSFDFQIYLMFVFLETLSILRSRCKNQFCWAKTADAFRLVGVQHFFFFCFWNWEGKHIHKKTGVIYCWLSYWMLWVFFAALHCYLGLVLCTDGVVRNSLRAWGIKNVISQICTVWEKCSLGAVFFLYLKHRDKSECLF